MNTLLSDLARRFAFNAQVLGMATADLSADDWSAPPSPKGGNVPHWILGHVAATRRQLLRKLGADFPELAWEADFARNASPEGTAGYPAPAELIADFVASGKELKARLRALTPAEADADFGGSFPDGGKTVAEAASFLHFHECYHLGQLGLLRRARGHAGIV